MPNLKHYSLILISKDKPHKTQRRRQLLPAKQQEQKVLDHFCKTFQVVLKFYSLRVPRSSLCSRFFRLSAPNSLFWSLTRSHTTVEGAVRHLSVNAGPNANPREGAPLPGTSTKSWADLGSSSLLKHTSHPQQNPWKPWASTPSTQNPSEGKKDLVFFFLSYSCYSSWWRSAGIEEEGTRRGG